MPRFRLNRATETGNSILAELASRVPMDYLWAPFAATRRFLSKYRYPVAAVSAVAATAGAYYAYRKYSPMVYVSISSLITHANSISHASTHIMHVAYVYRCAESRCGRRGVHFKRCKQPPRRKRPWTASEMTRTYTA